VTCLSWCVSSIKRFFTIYFFLFFRNEQPLDINWDRFYRGGSSRFVGSYVILDNHAGSRRFWSRKIKIYIHKSDWNVLKCIAFSTAWERTRTWRREANEFRTTWIRIFWTPRATNSKPGNTESSGSPADDDRHFLRHVYARKWRSSKRTVLRFPVHRDIYRRTVVTPVVTPKRD